MGKPYKSSASNQSTKSLKPIKFRTNKDIKIIKKWLQNLKILIKKSINILLLVLMEIIAVPTKMRIFIRRYKESKTYQTSYFLL